MRKGSKRNGNGETSDLPMLFDRALEGQFDLLGSMDNDPRVVDLTIKALEYYREHLGVGQGNWVRPYYVTSVNTEVSQTGKRTTLTVFEPNQDPVEYEDIVDCNGNAVARVTSYPCKTRQWDVAKRGGWLE